MMRFSEIMTATNQIHAADESFAQIANPNITEPGWKLCIPRGEAGESED
jgi:hypothetical protein